MCDMPETYDDMVKCKEPTEVFWEEVWFCKYVYVLWLLIFFDDNIVVLYLYNSVNIIMFAFAQIISFGMSSLIAYRTQTLGPQITEESPYHQSFGDPRAPYP